MMNNILNFIIELFNKIKVSLKTKFVISLTFGLKLIGLNLNITISGDIDLKNKSEK